MTSATIARFAALAGLLLLAGCGASGADTVSAEDVERVRSDPRIDAVRGIVERADTLLVPAVHLELTATVEGREERERLAFPGACEATACVLGGDAGDDGEGTITLADLIAGDLAIPADVDLTRLELGGRDGFDTLVVEGRSAISEKLGDDTIAATASATSWGAWGEHGYAAVEIVDASVEGGPLSGGMRSATAYVFGDRNPTNPEGRGSATWRGPAEAASTRTFARHEGTATLTIPDLAQPRIGAAIEVAGKDIGAPGWKDMPLAQGSFTSGTAGRDDYLEGNFHGPDHEEAYGVFDTGAYVGAFAAKRR